MSSWAVSACYPRRTFYPLSDGPSTQNHRITMTVFRLCSTCQSHSQASLCHCTLRTISDRSELTFARLRYYLGGDRPSQTTHHTMSCCRMTATVRCQEKQKRYFTGDSTIADATASMSPSYAKYVFPNTNVKLQ